MPDLFQTAIEFFSGDGWQFEQAEGQPVLRTFYEGQNGSWNCFAGVTDSQFSFYSVLPGSVPVERRRDMAEFLSRANFALVVGNFELNFANGQVRFKTSIDFEAEPPSAALLRPLVYFNVNTMNLYLPGIRKVNKAETTPEQAIAEIEGQNP